MPVSLAADLDRPRLGFVEKVWGINWGLLVLVTLIASIGFVTLYSAAGGSLHPWAGKQMIRFAAFTVMAIAVALVDIRVWRKLAYPIYAVVFVLLVVVEVKGAAKMGAERWIDL